MPKTTTRTATTPAPAAHEPSFEERRSAARREAADVAARLARLEVEDEARVALSEQATVAALEHEWNRHIPALRDARDAAQKRFDEIVTSGRADLTLSEIATVWADMASAHYEYWDNRRDVAGTLDMLRPKYNGIGVQVTRLPAGAYNTPVFPSFVDSLNAAASRMASPRDEVPEATARQQRIAAAQNAATSDEQVREYIARTAREAAQRKAVERAAKQPEIDKANAKAQALTDARNNAEQAEQERRDAVVAENERKAAEVTARINGTETGTALS